MAGDNLHIADGWPERLARAGLGRLDALFGTREGRVVSRHKRGQTRRLMLPDGAVLYLKRDHHTMLKEIVRQLLRGCRPEPLSEQERLAFERVSALGLRTPRAVAWGQQRRLGLPWRAALLMTAVEGESLREILRREAPPGERLAALRAAGQAVRGLVEAGLVWLDLLPRHVLLDAESRVGLIDLERLRSRGRARRRMERRVLRFSLLLRGLGAVEAEVSAFLTAAGYRYVPEGD